MDPAGAPVPGAEILWADGSREPPAALDIFDVHKVATADKRGRFWAPGLPPGPAFLVTDLGRMRIDEQRFRMTGATPVVLPLPPHGGTPEGESPELTLVHPESADAFATIRVAARSRDGGRPIARVPVAVFAADDLSRPVRHTVTSRGGNAKFEWLREGRYRFCMYGTRRYEGYAEELDVARGGTVELPVAVRKRPSGRGCTAIVWVRSHDGKLIEGAVVQVRLPTIHIPDRPTNAEGTVCFTRLPDRVASVSVAAAGHMTGVAAIPRDHHDEPLVVGMILRPAVRVRIVVVDEETGRPARDANVRVLHSNGERCAWGGIRPRAGAAPLDFRETDVGVGPVEIQASQPGGPVSSTTFVVAAGDPQPVVIRLGVS